MQIPSFYRFLFHLTKTNNVCISCWGVNRNVLEEGEDTHQTAHSGQLWRGLKSTFLVFSFVFHVFVCYPCNVSQYRIFIPYTSYITYFLSTYAMACITFFFLFMLHMRHIEVPGLAVELELQLKLTPQPQQHQI